MLIDLPQASWVSRTGLAGDESTVPLGEESATVLVPRSRRTGRPVCAGKR